MIVNPGVRRFLVSAIQRIFNSSQFSAPLLHTAIPERSAGETASFTRASTQTTINSDGYQVTCLSGEMCFPGARRVYNEWTTSSVTLASGANKSLTLAAGTYQFSMGVGTGTATFSGTGGATGTLAASASARTFVAKTITAGTFVVTASVADLVDLQVVSLTAETDQTTIREYVSVGVESAPYYHGSMVDGVKCFPTDLSGNPLTTMTGYESWEARTNLSFKSHETGTGGAGLTVFPTAADAAVTTSAVPSHWAGYNWLRIEEKATTAIHTGYWGNAAIVANSTNTATVDVMADTVTKCRVAFGDAALVNGCFVDVDLLTGTALGTGTYGTGTYTSNIIEALPLGGYRVKLTGKAAALTTISFVVMHTLQTAGVPSYLGTIGEGFYCIACQTETATSGSPQIINPNAVTSVTRNADVLTYTGGQVANYKTLLATFSRKVGVSNVGVMAALSDGTANEIEYMSLQSATAVRFDGVGGGVSQWQVTAGNAYTPASEEKSAFTAATNAVKIAFDGTATTNADLDTATLATVTALQVGHLNGASQLNGGVGGVYAWTRTLSQSELNAISK